jgi:outer membrane protein OmpA-like peptidoglycan-associated protein
LPFNADRSGLEEAAMSARIARPVGIAAMLVGVALAGCQSTAARKPRAGSAPLIARPLSCVDIAFPIYFEPGSAAITREADSLMAAARMSAQGCRVTGIVVVGLADARGAPDANLELSKHRADNVASALAAHGFTQVEFREAAGGAIGAATKAGADKPLRRRTDVSIHLAAPPR